MRIISTFNQTLYEASGQWMLESARQHLDCEWLLYTEDMPPIDGIECIDVRSVPEFEQVRSANRDAIYDEKNPAPPNLNGFLKRWFNWFRKVAAEYDAILRRPHDGITIFLDSDIRVMGRFDEAWLSRQLHKPVAIMQGVRDAAETGVIAFDERRPETREFMQRYMNIFLSGEFRSQYRWDDAYTMTVAARQNPQWVQDLAEGRAGIEHRNSNGHSTVEQVLPLTIWADYLEHDKGLHWRQGLVAAPVAGTSDKKKWSFSKLLRRLTG